MNGGQQPVQISLSSFRKTEMRSQIAALCYRQKKKRVEILLITTRRTGRWMIPKGWLMPQRSPGEAALIEAWEEAGVQGHGIEHSIGLFTYNKWISPDETLPCAAMVYPVRVTALAESYPESSERRRKWFTPKKAAAKIAEPELAAMLRHFDPQRLALPG